MMDAGPAAVEEPGDGAGLHEWGEQFDFGLAEGQRHDGGAVGFLGRMGLEAQDVTVKGEGRVEIRHGDADMSDTGAVTHVLPPTMLVEAVSTLGE
jgi:hypothetical protein